MKLKAMSVVDYEFKPEDALFLDTNIWLFIYGPQRPGDARAAVYSQALARILAVQSRIYIDALVLSEFINTYARLKWQLIAPHIKPYKAFRKSPDFKPVARDIAGDVKRVMRLSSRIESGFEALDVDDLMDCFAEGDADCNDQVIAALCKRKGLMLVTDDSDFMVSGIPIVTANKRLLR